MNFKHYTRITGWLIFAIALVVYSLTTEPTASFWDPAEYITVSSRLEIGHPPGAPLFQLIGAVFSAFAPDVEKIALAVNMASAVSAAFAIAFLFWSLVLLLQKILKTGSDIPENKAAAILGSSAVGALAFAFTDSFWFVAAEAEVYAMATCFMALLFYLGLLWERDMNSPRGYRWLVLMSLVIGLSFGVRFLALLAVPAIGYLYYFKNCPKITVKNFIAASALSAGALLFLYFFLFPMGLRFFASSELFFVNEMNMPFHSGTIIAGLAVVAGFYFLIRYTHRRGLVLLNVIALCFMFIFIGASSWMMLPIRASAGPVMNQNNPDNARALLAYYNREQYGETALIYGPQYTAMYVGLDEKKPMKDGKPYYEKDTARGEYIVAAENKNAIPNYAHKTMLPRMHSRDEGQGNHPANYMIYSGPPRFSLKREYRGEQELVDFVNEFKQRHAEGQVDYREYHDFLKRFRRYLDVEKPSFFSNMRYMFQFQFGYMYWRYFMWNFAGRQNDLQGRLDDRYGNWLSGIKFIDEWRLGPQDSLPSDMRDNKARNTYYFLPLLIGLLGVFFHYNRDKRTFWVLLMLFFFTGLAVKIFLNERPFEPRERDYALVGSFYAFAFWIGLGAYALFEGLKKYLGRKLTAPVAIVVCLLLAPVLLAAKNWDDHDRSGRYSNRVIGKMYMDSLDENALIFTIGDNDTFPLWYLQDVERYRTDVRVVNTQYINIDWYIDDMKKQAFESAPIPSQLTHAQYRTGTREQLLWHLGYEMTDTVDIDAWMNWVASDDARTRISLSDSEEFQTFPSRNIRIPVDREAVLRNGIVAEKDADLIVPYIDIRVPEEMVKGQMMMLDIIANNSWERPIYFSGGSYADSEYIWMKDYLQLDGLAYKLVPIKTPVEPDGFEMGRVDTEKMYDIVTNWDWSTMGSPDIYHDPETRRNTTNFRLSLVRLVEALIEEGKKERAKHVIDMAMEHMPVTFYNQNLILVEPFVTGYFQVGEYEKGKALFLETARLLQERMVYYSSLPYRQQSIYLDDIDRNIRGYISLLRSLDESGDEAFAEEQDKILDEYLELFDLGEKGD